MPHLRVKVDGSVVVEIPTDDCSMLGFRISGTRDDDDFANLSAWSGVYGQGADDVHRIWIDSRPLTSGQLVEVEFVNEGKKIGEGVPFDSSGSAEMPAGYSLEDDLHALAQELREQRWVRAAYRFRYESSDSATADFALSEDEYGFGFHVMWNDMHPERVSVSLYAYTIESIEQQRSGRDLVSQYVAIGQSCEVSINA